MPIRVLPHETEAADEARRGTKKERMPERQKRELLSGEASTRIMDELASIVHERKEEGKAQQVDENGDEIPPLE